MRWCVVCGNGDCPAAEGRYWDCETPVKRISSLESQLVEVMRERCEGLVEAVQLIPASYPAHKRLVGMLEALAACRKDVRTTVRTSTDEASDTDGK